MSEEKQTAGSSEDTLANKYRPKTLDRVIGHESEVARLKGIIKSQKYPKALLFTGPSSAGKTTIARAFVSDLFGVKTLKGNQDYHESNASDTRGIDDLRDMLKVARLKPRFAPRRVFMVDEAQGLTGPSAGLLLKPLEDPPPNTMFILGSMEPEKLPQAMKNRCSQFVLGAPSKEGLTKYVKRIAKGEEMKYMTDDLLEIVVNNSNGEFRSAANIMEAVQQFAAGSDGKVTAKNIATALESTNSNDDQLAVKILLAVYANKLKVVQKSLLDITDSFKLIGTLMRLNSFLLNVLVLEGAQHKAVWWSQQHKELDSGIKQFSKVAEDKRLIAYNVVQSALVDMRARSGSFLVPEATLIGSCLFNATMAIKPYMEKK